MKNHFSFPLLELTTVLIGFTAFSLQAQSTNSNNLTVLGYIAVTNNIYFGTSTATNQFGAQINYTDSNSSVGLTVTRPGATILFQENATNPKTKLRVDSSNTLSLYGTNGSVGVTLNPNTGGIQLNGTGAGLTLADGTVLRNSNSLRSTGLYDGMGNQWVSFDSNGNMVISAPIKLSGTNVGIDFGSGTSLNQRRVSFLNQTLSNLGYQETALIPDSSASFPGNFSIMKVAADASGSYISGTYSGTVNIGGTTLNGTGCNDVFVAKISTNGAVLWASGFGGTQDSFPTGIAVDGSGNACVTGYFGGIINSGVPAIVNGPAGGDSFIVKFNSTGGVAWATNVNSDQWSESAGITGDTNGNFYITGRFGGTITQGNLSATSDCSQEAFVLKISSSGIPQWVQALHSDSYSYATGIAVDGSGNLFVTGGFWGEMLTQTVHVFGSYNWNCEGVFEVKLNNTGAPTWGIGFAPDAWTTPAGIVVDTNGNSYISGNISGTITGYYTNSNMQPAGIIYGSGVRVDAYLIKINSSGMVSWGRNYGGGTEWDAASGLGIDSNGNIYLIGNFTATMDKGVTPTLTSNGGGDLFVVKVNGSGTEQWAASFGGTGNDTDADIAVAPNGQIIIVGNAASNFNMGDQVMATGPFVYRGVETSLVSYALISTASFSWGGSRASSAGSVAVGMHAAASSEGAVALGGGESGAGYSISAGFATRSDGYASVAFGVNNNATGSNSTVFGENNNAVGDHAMALGYQTKANAFASLAMGQNNVGLVTTNSAPIYDGNGNVIGVCNGYHNWIPTDPVLEIGNGSYSFTPSDALTVFKNGNMRSAGVVESKGGVRVPPTGDLSMGSYTNGVNPATLNPATGLLYPSGN